MRISPIWGSLALVFTVGCGDDNKLKDDAAVVHDAGVDASCFTNPTTHVQLLNACTSPGVEVIYKDSHPPLLNADGSLPPLP